MRIVGINRAWKKLQFQLVLWASSSQILLARYPALGKHQRYLAKQENVLVPDHRTGILRALINSTTQYRIQTLRLGGGGGGRKDGLEIGGSPGYATATHSTFRMTERNRL